MKIQRAVPKGDGLAAVLRYDASIPGRNLPTRSVSRYPAIALLSADLLMSMFASPRSFLRHVDLSTLDLFVLTCQSGSIARAAACKWNGALATLPECT